MRFLVRPTYAHSIVQIPICAVPFGAGAAAGYILAKLTCSDCGKEKGGGCNRCGQNCSDKCENKCNAKA